MARIHIVASLRSTITAIAIGIALVPQYLLGANIQDIDRILVIVNDDVITQSEFQRELENIVKELRAREAKLPRHDVLQRQALERMILERIQIQYAERAGIRVPDAMLNIAMQDLAAQNNLTVEQMADVVKRDGIDYAYFRENLRKQLTIRRLVDREVAGRVTVNDDEIENFLANEVEGGSLDREFHISHILVSIPEGASQEDIDKIQSRAGQALEQVRNEVAFGQVAAEFSDGRDALQEGELGWKKVGQLPTLFLTAIHEMQPGDISDLLRSPNGFHIVKLNQVRGGAQQMVEQIRARHILIRPDGLLSEEEAEERLTQLRDRILGGEDFAELAKAHSDDAMTSSKGGDLGWISPGEVHPQIESTAARLQPDQVSQPVRTNFGYHIVQLLGHRTQELGERLDIANARQQIHARKADERYEQWIRQLRDESYIEFQDESN